MENSFHFAELLRSLRNKKGLSQEKLGELLGVSNSAICKYESRPTPPDGATIQKISDQLGVSCDYLLGREPTGTISFFMLNDKQTEIIKDLVEMFREQNTRIASQLTNEQYKMIGRIVACFLNR